MAVLRAADDPRREKEVPMMRKDVGDSTCVAAWKRGEGIARDAR